jgi:hypothetical protein
LNKLTTVTVGGVILFATIRSRLDTSEIAAIDIVKIHRVESREIENVTLLLHPRIYLFVRAYELIQAPRFVTNVINTDLDNSPIGANPSRNSILNPATCPRNPTAQWPHPAQNMNTLVWTSLVLATVTKAAAAKNEFFL